MPYSKKRHSHASGNSDIRPTSSLANVTKTADKVQLLQLPGNWVSVATRTPPCAGSYLTILRGGRYRLMEFEARDNRFTPRSLHPVVTHWMPLPLPPQ